MLINAFSIELRWKWKICRDGNLHLPRSQPSTERGLHGSLQQCPFLSRRPVQCCCCGCWGSSLRHISNNSREFWLSNYIPTEHSLAVPSKHPSPLKMATNEKNCQKSNIHYWEQLTYFVCVNSYQAWKMASRAKKEEKRHKQLPLPRPLHPSS